MALPILIVEDEQMVAEALIEVLAFLPNPVLWARSGEEGWSIYEKNGARLVITDNSLGPPPVRMTGFDLAKRVKEASPSTLVLMLTAMPPDEALLVCDAVLQKPVPLRELMGVLRALGIGTDAESQPAPCRYLRRSLSQKHHVGEPGACAEFFDCTHPDNRRRLTGRGSVQAGPDGYFAAVAHQEDRPGFRPCAPGRACYKPPNGEADNP